jgi:hypothetical protein
MITYLEAKYLKHSGEQIDTKVTICTLNGEVRLHIGDFEFDDFNKARKHLQHIGETLAPVREKAEGEEVAA